MIRIRQSINRKIQLFDNIIKGADEKIADRVENDKIRWLCRNDLFFLSGVVGNDLISKYPEYYAPICDEVSLMNWLLIKIGQKPSEDMLLPEEVADEEDFRLLQRLYLCYRTFYKTTIITKAHSTQLLLNFPNIHIVLCHNKQANASANLIAIKNSFLTTPLKKRFPECIPGGKEWGNMSAFSLANRTDWNRDEHNLMAVGVDTEITGGHWQVAKKNDLVTQDSVNTKEQIEKTLDWDSRFNVGHFDDPQFKVQDYEGTKYHFIDLYATKIGDKSIKLIEFPILKDKDVQNLSESNISNPKRFSVEGIKDMMSDMWVFNCQMLLNPDDPAKMQFKPEMIQYFSEIPSGVNYLVVDPASKRKKKSDYTVMLVIRYCWYRDKLSFFIVDGIRDKLNPKQRIDNAIDLANKWNIRESGWEEVGLGDDNFYLEERRREKNLFFTVTPIKTQQVAKEDRIRNLLLPEYAQHKWFWAKKGSLTKMSQFDGRSYDLTEDLEDEFLHFPLAQHDDLLDAMTFMSKMNLISPEKVEIKEKRNSPYPSYGEYIKMKEDRIKFERSDPWAFVGR
jgi:hypothetical protein